MGIIKQYRFVSTIKKINDKDEINMTQGTETKSSNYIYPVLELFLHENYQNL